MIFNSNTISLNWDNKTKLFTTTQVFDFNYKGKIYTIPKGFITDFASIPKFLRSVVSINEHHVLPAIIHDYLYSGNTLLSRKECDILFKDAMKEVGVSWWKRYAMYKAVRINGNRHFIKN